MLAPATTNDQNSHKKRTTRLGRNEKLCQTEARVVYTRGKMFPPRSLRFMNEQRGELNTRTCYNADFNSYV